MKKVAVSVAMVSILAGCDDGRHIEYRDRIVYRDRDCPQVSQQYVPVPVTTERVIVEHRNDAPVQQQYNSGAYNNGAVNSQQNHQPENSSGISTGTALVGAAAVGAGAYYLGKKNAENKAQQTITQEPPKKDYSYQQKPMVPAGPPVTTAPKKTFTPTFAGSPSSSPKKTFSPSFGKR